MSESTTPRRRRVKRWMVYPAVLLLIGVFVPPQLRRTQVGRLRPTEVVNVVDPENGWPELVAIGHRLQPAPLASRLAQNTALVPEVDAALSRQYLFVPADPAWACPKLEPADHDSAVGALELLDLQAADDVAHGRQKQAISRWRALLRTGRTLTEKAQSELTVELGFQTEQAVYRGVQQAVNTITAPLPPEVWQPLRNQMAEMWEPRQLAMSWRSARYRVLYCRRFAPRTVPPALAAKGLAKLLDRLPPTSFDDPWDSLARCREFTNRIYDEARKPRTERDWELLEELAKPSFSSLYNLRGQGLPGQLLHGGDWPGFDGEDYQLTVRVMTDTMLALRFAYDRDGHLPAALPELVDAGWLEAAPEDPFNDWPIQYDAARRLLWSVGSDEQDDGGAQDEGSTRPDIVVRLDFAGRGPREKP